MWACVYKHVKGKSTASTASEPRTPDGNRSLALAAQGCRAVTASHLPSCKVPRASLRGAGGGASSSVGLRSSASAEAESAPWTPRATFGVLSRPPDASGGRACGRLPCPFVCLWPFLHSTTPDTSRQQGDLSFPQNTGSHRLPGTEGLKSNGSPAPCGALAPGLCPTLLTRTPGQEGLRVQTPRAGPARRASEGDGWVSAAMCDGHSRGRATGLLKALKQSRDVKDRSLPRRRIRKVPGGDSTGEGARMRPPVCPVGSCGGGFAQTGVSCLGVARQGVSPCCGKQRVARGVPHCRSRPLCSRGVGCEFRPTLRWSRIGTHSQCLEHSRHCSVRSVHLVGVCTDSCVTHISDCSCSQPGLGTTRRGSRVSSIRSYPLGTW